jgi:hypothetical protein
MKLFELFIIALGSLVFIVLFSFLLSWPVYMLWNGCLIGAVDGVHQVSWMQAWGLSLLFGIMFKSTGSSNKAS